MTVKFVGYTGVNIAHCCSYFGKLCTDFLRLFILPFGRNTVNGKILCLNSVFLTKHIADTHRLKTHILTAVAVAPDRKLRIAKFKDNTLKQCYAVADTFLDNTRYCQGTKLNTQDTLKSISKEIGFFYFDLKSELSRQRLKFKSKDGN